MYTRRRKYAEANPSGLCMCGCGELTPLATEQRGERGYYAGQHLRFIPGHHKHLARGPNASRWKGGRHTLKSGYVFAYAPDHPHATRDGYVLEHRLVMEQLLGRVLDRRTEHVHHINGIKGDNRPENLVVLTRSAHHRLHYEETLKPWREADPQRASLQAFEAGWKGADHRWADHVPTSRKRR